jgi:hypothetical protein
LYQLNDLSLQKQFERRHPLPTSENFNQGRPLGRKHEWEGSGEINREAYLPAKTRARDVLTSQQSETEVQPFANDILAPGHGLNLRFSQISVFGVSSEDLGPKRERRAKIMRERKPAWKNMSPRGLDPQRTSTGIAGKQIP